MPQSEKKPGTAIIHVGSAIAQPVLFPVGKQYRVSASAHELLDDFRSAACKFGSSTDAKEIEDHYVAMQMRYADLTSYISTIEKHFGIEQSVAMKF